MPESGDGADGLPPIPAGVQFVPGTDEAIQRWWRKNYADTVARAGGGAPTATAVTTRWAAQEVAWAREHGTEPVEGVPPH